MPTGPLRTPLRRKKGSAKETDAYIRLAFEKGLFTMASQESKQYLPFTMNENSDNDDDDENDVDDDAALAMSMLMLRTVTKMLVKDT